MSCLTHYTAVVLYVKLGIFLGYVIFNTYPIVYMHIPPMSFVYISDNTKHIISVCVELARAITRYFYIGKL